MGKSNRYDKERSDDEREARRQDRILEEIAVRRRAEKLQPSFFHDNAEKKRRKKNRKNERGRLHDVAREYNGGIGNE